MFRTPGDPATSSVTKTITTQIEEKKKANQTYKKAAKEGLAAMKMETMAEGLGADFIKFSVCTVSNKNLYQLIILDCRSGT